MGKHKSRARRYEEAMGNLEAARSECEELKDELESWRDNLPENMQDGEKACQLDEAIDALDTVVCAFEEIEGTDVEFPGMFG